MKTAEQVIQYISEYGDLLIFILIYFEQLNFPGISATLLLPAIGVYIAKSQVSFMGTFLVVLSASVLGSISLYLIGYWVGQPMTNWVKRKLPKSEKHINKVEEYLNKYGKVGEIICRFIPGLRTIISLISGTVRENFYEFFIYSCIGIVIWNLVLILTGYLATTVIWVK